MKIMWFSRHAPIPKQITELMRIFGDNTKVIIDPKPFSNADDVIERYKKSGSDEMVIVAPMTVINELLKRGIKPLYAEMEQVNSGEEYDVEANGRKYKFLKFTRIVKIDIIKEDL